MLRSGINLLIIRGFRSLNFLFLLSCGLLIFSCKGEVKTPLDLSIAENTDTIPDEVLERNLETQEMVTILADLYKNASTEDNIYINQRKADQLKQELNAPNVQYHGLEWYLYCQELLRAGNPRESIKELESNFDRNYPLGEQMTPQNYYLFDLLTLAHLRAGEQENCQNFHNEFSCILPLNESAFHQMPEGSSNAIQIYQAMYDRHPTDTYKWLINLAYMTLGKHPAEVPNKYLINYPNWNLEQKEFPRFKEVAMGANVATNGLSGGTCIDDFDNDGLIDVFVTDYGMQGQTKLSINNGHGSFDDVTVSAGLKGIVSGLNCVHADYDNDGFLDIFVTRGAWLEGAGKHPNSLLKNNGDGTFSDVTKSAGLLSYFPTQTASWADFNKDGFIDLFVGNENEPCELFQNNGDGTFIEVSQEKGLKAITQFVKGVTWGDINNDNWPDLFISVLGGKNMLFKNNAGVFEDVSESAGIQEPIYSFPCWFWDVNNDGFQDLYVAGYQMDEVNTAAGAFSKEMQELPIDISQPRLYLNNKDETFKDVTNSFQLAKPGYAMGANFGDLDNDGYLDFYLGTGSPKFYDVVPNRMFRNVNGKRFEEVTSAGGFGHIQKGHGIGFADIDRDGDQDIYAVMGGAYEGDAFTNVLFENPGFENNWIILELEGVTTNRRAIGTRLEIQLDNGKKIYRTVGTGGTFGASSLQQEIGLGRAGLIKKLVIYWQNGETQTFETIAINQKIKITEGQTEFELIPYNYIPFSESTGHHHH